jgi:hypothetical protein
VNATHTLLKAALAIAKTARPAAPPHLGGPAPKLSAPATARIAIWCAERMRDRATPRLAAIMAPHLAEARTFLERPDAARESRARLADPRRYPRGAESVARLAVEAALRSACKPGQIAVPTRDAVRMSIRLERDAAATVAESDAAMCRFVDDLDQELMRVEVETILVPRVDCIPAFGRVLWRAVGPGLDRATHFVVALEPEGYGLLAKLGGRYSWHEGGRDEILATVPDGMFESAVTAVGGGIAP